MSGLNLDVDTCNSSNIGGSWRTLIEFPAEKVACAIFVQETLTCMIKQKLINSSEEIDEAMMKLYDMLKFNNESNSSDNVCNSVVNELVSDLDSVKSTCGTVIQLDTFGDDLNEILSLADSESNNKCCQASLDLSKKADLDVSQLEPNPLEVLFRRGIDVLSNNLPVERVPQTICFRLNEYPQNLFENNLNFYRNPYVLMNDHPGNYVMVVEEGEQSDLEVSSHSKHSNRSNKHRFNEKRSSTKLSDEKDGTKHSSRKKSFRSDKHKKVKSDNRPRKASKSPSKLIEKIRGAKKSDLMDGNDARNYYTPYHKGRDEWNSLEYWKSKRNKPLSNSSSDSHLVIFQAKAMETRYFGILSWIGSIYNLFVAVIEVTRSAYCRLL